MQAFNRLINNLAHDGGNLQGFQRFIYEFVNFQQIMYMKLKNAYQFGEFHVVNILAYKVKPPNIPKIYILNKKKKKKYSKIKVGKMNWLEYLLVLCFIIVINQFFGL